MRWRLLAIAAVFASMAYAQTRPDFSGVWVLDAAHSDRFPYGELRVVRQGADAVDFSAIGYAGPPSIPGLDVVPWKLRIGKWGPRRGPETSKEPKVQARWDGDKLLYVKSPGESFSVLFIWSMTGPDEMKTENASWEAIPYSFDFRESSIPHSRRSVHYYRRVSEVEDWSPLPDGQPLSVNLTPDKLTVTCHVAECRRFEIFAGRRVNSTGYPEGRVLNVPLGEQSRIEFPGHE